MISVIIPVKDGGDDLRRCLDGIARQRTNADVETLVVDSGSRDRSRELAQSRGARVLEVESSGFRHGATRNLGAAQARGDLLVFTTQDAYAADEHWLERLCAPLRTDEDVAGVYGRQLPNADASPPERAGLVWRWVRGRWAGPVSCWLLLCKDCVQHFRTHCVL